MSGETHEIIAARVVTFDDDSGEHREVLRDCRVCYCASESYGTAVVSPSGIAHIAPNDTTLCGKDATRDRWWWQL